MKSFSLLTIVIIFLIIVFSFLLWLFLKSKNKVSIWEKKGTIIFKLDPITKIVSPYIFNKKNQTRSKIASWIQPQYKNNISNALKLFALIISSKEGKKIYNDILEQVSNNQETIKHSFITQDIRLNREKTTIKFNFLLRKIVDLSDYLILINWKIHNYKKSKTILKQVLPIEKIIDKKTEYKGFIAFDLNERIPSVQEKLIKEINPILNKKKYDIFNASNLLIVTCYAKKYKKIKKKVQKFIKYVENKIIRTGIAQFIDGSGSARLKNISSKKEMYKTLATLDFLTNLSLRWNEFFVDIRTAQTFKQEFITYNEAAKKFRDLIRLHNFKNKFIAVKNRKSQRKIIDYCIPDLESFDKYEIKNILLSESNRKQLKDANLEKILDQKNIEESILIDVNGSWLLKNFERLRSGKICYIIKIDNYTYSQEIETLIFYLIKKDFLIGLRLDSFSQFLVTLISKIKPIIVIVDQKIIEEKNLNDTLHYTKLLSLKNIFEAIGIKVIFENLTLQTSNQIVNKLEINFYLNY